jgi:hypothetical protein
MLVALAVAGSVAAATAPSLVEGARASPTTRFASEKTTLRVVALKSPVRLRLDQSAPVSVTVANRGRKTVRSVAVRLSLGPIPDPGFKITWATARSGALKPGASRSFTFHIKISSRFDKDHIRKVSGQTISFYGAGNYVLEACTGLALSSDEGCRESHTITAL